jgi:hypothetical protein
MDEFAFLLINSGSGLEVATVAANQGQSVAVVENGPLGGACLNRGCIPSKLLRYHADVPETVERAEEFNIDAEVTDVDLPGSSARRTRQSPRMPSRSGTGSNPSTSTSSSRGRVDSSTSGPSRSSTATRALRSTPTSSPIQGLGPTLSLLQEPLSGTTDSGLPHGSVGRTTDCCPGPELLRDGDGDNAQNGAGHHQFAGVTHG